MTSQPGMSTIVVVGSMNADLSVPDQPAAGGDGHRLRYRRPHWRQVLEPGRSRRQARATVAMVGAVGDDQYAKIPLDSAAAAGVGISDVVTLPGAATGTAMIVVDAAAENTIVVSPGANDQLCPEGLPGRLVSDASVLCLALENPIETVLRAAEIAEEAGTTVVLNLSPYREVPPELLRATTVLVVNEDELACLSGASEDVVDGDVAQRVLGSIGIRNAVVTLGADGALVLTPAGVAVPRCHA